MNPGSQALPAEPVRRLRLHKRSQSTGGRASSWQSQAEPGIEGVRRELKNILPTASTWLTQSTQWIILGRFFLSRYLEASVQEQENLALESVKRSAYPSALVLNTTEKTA